MTISEKIRRLGGRPHIDKEARDLIPENQLIMAQEDIDALRQTRPRWWKVAADWRRIWLSPMSEGRKNGGNEWLAYRPLLTQLTVPSRTRRNPEPHHDLRPEERRHLRRPVQDGGGRSDGDLNPEYRGGSDPALSGADAYGLFVTIRQSNNRSGLSCRGTK